MRTEDAIREALGREAARHPVNPVLPRGIRTKARAARVVTVGVVAMAVTSLVVGGASLVGAVRGDGGRAVGPAGESGEENAGPAYAYGAPLLLLEGWTVTRADQYGDEGEMTFANGERSVDLFWRDPAAYDMYVEDRADGAGASWDVTIAGADARLFQYEGTTQFTALWRAGEHTFELRGAFPDVEAYEAMAAELKWVDEAAWVAALPEDTVAAGEREAVVDEMLAEIGHHRDYRLAKIRVTEEMIDRYQLGAAVTGAVACYWIEMWLDAKERGDERGIGIAGGAMGAARHWPILKEMEDQGDWSEVLWEHADAMKRDDTIVAGSRMTLEESYRNALGCDREL